MRRNWRSRTLGILGVGALVMGAGVVVAAPAGAAPVADAAALRAAIESVNGAGADTEIELVSGTTYSLPGGSCKDENNNAAGDLDIRRSHALKIFTADGSAPAILESTCPDQRIIDFGGAPNEGTGKLTLRNVVLRNGHAPNRDDGANLGGAILSTGEVIVENSVFENNTAGDGSTGNADRPGGGAGGFGGAIFSLAPVTIDGSTFTGNKAGNGGAGFGQTTKECDGGPGGQGGAVFALQGLTITDSTFTGNTAGSGGNGGDSRCGEKTTVSGAGGDGGSGGAVQCGLLAPAGSPRPELFGCLKTMVVRGSTFSGNATGNGGKGGTGSTGGAGGAGGNGGAIMFLGTRAIGEAPASSLNVENSTVDGNSSGNGGNGGDGGNAGDGGAGGKAGAIAARYTTRGDDATVANLVHVTITENGGGGNPGTAGKADVLQPAVAAAAAGEAGADGAAGGGSVAMSDVWTSTSTVIGTSNAAADGPDCWRKAFGPQFSVATDADTDTTACGFGAASPFAGFALGALADNGGPTQTRLPGPDSSLVDKVSGVEPQLTADQRGVPRPQATKADIGAVELQVIDMTMTKTASASSVTAGTKVTFTIAVKGTGKVSPQPGVVIDDPNCEGLSAASGDSNTNNTLDPGEEFSYTCTATPSEAGTFTNTATATVTDAAGVKITRTASVDVTVTGSSTPILAKTGTNNPLPELGIGAGLLLGGVALLLITRQRRIKIRPHTEE